MGSVTVRLICRLLIASLFVLPFQGAQAGMIGTEQAAAVGSALADRAAVRNLLTRADVAAQLQSMGVDQANALERVAALTDSEVRSLAGKIDALPAGAGSNGWGLLLLIVIGVVIYNIWK